VNECQLSFDKPIRFTLPCPTIHCLIFVSQRSPRLEHFVMDNRQSFTGIVDHISLMWTLLLTLFC